jgi:hypothetical protein
MSTDTHHTMEVPMKIPGGKKTAVLYVGYHDPLDEAYFAKVMALTLEPGLTIIRVSHDDTCPKLKGDPCRCDAEVGAELYQP